MPHQTVTSRELPHAAGYPTAGESHSSVVVIVLALFAVFFVPLFAAFFVPLRAGLVRSFWSHFGGTAGKAE